VSVIHDLHQRFRYLAPRSSYQKSSNKIEINNNMSEETSKENNISPFGLARSTVKDQPLSKEELDKYTRYFNATLYICLG
jgi:hypothetical protein